MSQLLTEPIVALATPEGIGTVAVLRVSGRGCGELLRPLLFCRRSPSTPLSVSFQKRGVHAVALAWWPPQALPVPAWLAVFPNGASYTGEESYEIYLPGAPAVVRRTLQTFHDSGIRQAEPGEFTRRAFLNGRIDLTRAESVSALIEAESQAALQAARRVLDGGLATAVMELGNSLHDVIALLEAGLDFSEQEVSSLSAAELRRQLEPCLRQLQSMLGGARYQVKPAPRLRCLLLGRANAGKSTLFNALVNEARALVSDRAGTTRDAVTASLRFSGETANELQLVDLPGYLDGPDPAAAVTNDEIERHALQIAARWVEEGDRVLYCIDAKRPLAERELEWQSLHPQLRARCWWVLTQCDGVDGDGIVGESSVGESADGTADDGTAVDESVAEVESVVAEEVFATRVDSLPGEGLRTSARTGEGVAQLRAMLEDFARGGGWDSRGGADLVSERQLHQLQLCQERLQRLCDNAADAHSDELVAIDLREAHRHLEELTGELCVEGTLDRIFQKFCLGK